MMVLNEATTSDAGFLRMIRDPTSTGSFVLEGQTADMYWPEGLSSAKESPLAMGVSAYVSAAIAGSAADRRDQRRHFRYPSPVAAPLIWSRLTQSVGRDD